MKNRNTMLNVLTPEQYEAIITTLKTGFPGYSPDDRVATALVLGWNLGVRIRDILRLCPSDFVQVGDCYHLVIIEQKTGEHLEISVPWIVRQYIKNYCVRNGIQRNDLMFPIAESEIGKQLDIACDYLGFERISIYSFRNWDFAVIYKNGGYDMAMTQKFLQHIGAAKVDEIITRILERPNNSAY